MVIISSRLTEADKARFSSKANLKFFLIIVIIYRDIGGIRCLPSIIPQVTQTHVFTASQDTHQTLTAYSILGFRATSQKPKLQKIKSQGLLRFYLHLAKVNFCASFQRDSVFRFEIQLFLIPQVYPV